jgi:uncharacterized protein YbcC (UPF0753/DUF2309 family)
MGPRQDYEPVSINGKFHRSVKRMVITINADLAWWKDHIQYVDRLPADCSMPDRIRGLFRKAKEIDEQNKDEVEL